MTTPAIKICPVCQRQFYPSPPIAVTCSAVSCQPQGTLVVQIPAGCTSNPSVSSFVFYDQSNPTVPLSNVLTATFYQSANIVILTRQMSTLSVATTQLTSVFQFTSLGSQPPLQSIVDSDHVTLKEAAPTIAKSFFGIPIIL